MKQLYVAFLGLTLLVSACSPAPPTTQATPTPSPAKQKMLQLNNTGWAP